MDGCPNTADTAWPIEPGDDASLLARVQGLVFAAARIDQQRVVRVVRIDNWFGSRWLSYCRGSVLKRKTIRQPARGSRQKTIRVPEPPMRVPPFHPQRVLSDRLYTLAEDGTVTVGCEAAEPMHRRWDGECEDRHRRFDQTMPHGMYAWLSGNTQQVDRAALLVCSHGQLDTHWWFVEWKQNKSDWRLSQRIEIGAAELDWLQRAADWKRRDPVFQPRR